MKDEPSYSAPEEEGELSALEERLERLAADQQSIAAEARALDDAPGLSRVASTLEETWATEATPAREASPATRLAFWLLPLAAAAVLLVLLFGEGAPDPARPDRPAGMVLDSGDPGGLALAREADGRAAVVWSGPADARYSVTLRDAATGELLVDGERTRERRLVLDPERHWPARLFVEVELVEDDGTRRAASAVLERE